MTMTVDAFDQVVVDMTHISDENLAAKLCDCTRVGDFDLITMQVGSAYETVIDTSPADVDPSVAPGGDRFEVVERYDSQEAAYVGHEKWVRRTRRTGYGVTAPKTQTTPVCFISPPPLRRSR